MASLIYEWHIFSGVSLSTRIRPSACSRPCPITVLISAASKLAMARTCSSESSLTFLLNWNSCYSQLHHWAADLFPHLDWDALQQEDCLCLPRWFSAGGVQVFFHFCNVPIWWWWWWWWSRKFWKFDIPWCSFQKHPPFQEFHNQYGHKINTATRPYSFIEFDTYIQVGETFGI